MIRRKAVRNLIAVVYALGVTIAVGRWSVHVAHLKRGYEAIGGEYCLILMVYLGAWKAINYLFDTLEELEHERSSKKKRSGGTSWMRDNR